ncbi:hypothetical protein ACFLQY_01455 [Verrucomicrobiota bacterium]
MDLKRSLGIGDNIGSQESRDLLIKYINLKLSAMGQPIYEKAETAELEIAIDLIENIRERDRILHDYQCPVDQRIQNFLSGYFKDVAPEGVTHLPNKTLVLDRYGLARELSIAPDQEEFNRDGIHSYRIKQGVLHNPKNDRRTTKGVFHVVEGGLQVGADKKEVPKQGFVNLLAAALNPPKETMELPFTSSQEKSAHTFVSLLLRPMVSPEVPGFLEKKNMEVRFFAPGNYICNLDFVESIFGNAGDPYLPANDAALDPDHWTGYTGCVILAPHICGLNKKDLGLPHYDDATERQRRDGMCWKSEDELYNEGSPFKICCRDASGVIVTLIADNYFGYCKKEVKTQIGYAANLYGLCEEEHAGGALATPRWNLGESFIPDSTLYQYDHTMEDVIRSIGDKITIYPEGYAVDKQYPGIFYVPEDSRFDLDTQTVSWELNGETQTVKLLAERTFIYPCGYRVNMEKNEASNTWRLIGTVGEGTLCHKPCTVSGGGKSEISKSISDAMISGSVFVSDLEKDMDAVEQILSYNFATRFKEDRGADYQARPILSKKRSLGSVIKLLNPSPENNDEFNEWLNQIPNRIKGLVFMVKRHYKEEWGNDWRKHFTVDFINGEMGHELKFNGQKMAGKYLRIGMSPDGTWRTSKLRTDFIPSAKVQWEDDISASIVVPTHCLENLNPEYKAEAVKIVENCEYRFFQRPDEAVVRGFDKQAEADLASSGNFISNFEAHSKEDAIDLMERSVTYNQYTEPMRDMIKEVATSDKEKMQFVDSASPRIVNGAPSKNPRYLQTRPDLIDGKGKYLALTGTRLARKVPADKPLYTPVNAVLPGRRNNPAEREAGIRALAVYGPIHYQELPELFMDFICSLTGKSPSTTGAGSEGALTKGPFNALVATADLNNALLSFLLTGANGFSTAAGYIGSNYKVEHDVSLLIPELWCRMIEEERDPKMMIEKGLLEKVEDFEYNGKKVVASRLGYRITECFVNEYLGKIFEAPNTVFESGMLRPEEQDMEDFVDGINNICETQERIASQFIADGSVEGLIPPLKALIYIMAEGSYEGKKIDDPAIREMFTREAVVNSDWYQERLKIKQDRKADCCTGHIKYLEDFMSRGHNAPESARMGLEDRLASVKARREYVLSDKFLTDSVGTLGADPIGAK